jgi:serine/threonine protein kinase
MAPEQARGEPVDARTDLYAVGVMLWEAVTGRRRWPTGITEPALFTQLATGEPPASPNAASRGLPSEIDAVVMRALAPKPEDRYQTAAELRDALDAVVRNLEPVSLRALSAMLSKTFSEDRRRLRNVIEEQFRSIDAGDVPSGSRQLPAVPPPSVTTGSKATQLAPPTQDAPVGTQDAVGGDTLIESRSRRITEAPDLRSTRPRSRIVILVAGALIAVAFVLGVAIPRARSVPAAQPASALSSSREATSASPQATTDDAEPQAPANAATSAGNAQPGEPASRSDVPNRRGPAPVATHSARAPSPSATPASSDAPGKDPTPLRTPQTRPKVQLERDNPWP